nr:RagB/SusD family nutrient uptake outer membrane protein [Rikenellaceae bacterium]
MKTNKIFAKAMLVAATVVLSGCSSFLDEENISSQSAEAFFATAKGYESLTVGAYETLNSIYNSTNYYTLTQLGTDTGTQGNGSVTNDLNQYVPTYMNDNGAVNSQWNALYGALKNINAAINRAPGVVTKTQDPLDGIDETLLATRVAEMKFLRALVLFEIVKNWGQAPLLLEEPTSASTTSQLDSGELFYKQILQDLGDVISSNLPLKQPASDYGRASKAAAYHLRALVYLTRGYQSYAESTDFANALADAEYVIEKSGHALQYDFLDVHKDANEENDEIIFAVNYDAATNYNRNIYTSFWMFPYREGFGGMTFSAIYGADWGSVMPTKYAYLLFDWKKDRRAQVTFMSPLNGDAATSVDGKTLGANHFDCLVDNYTVPKGEPCIYFPVPVEADFKVWSEAEKEAAAAAGCVYYNYPTGSIAEGSYNNAGNDDFYKTGYQSKNVSTRAWLPVYKFKDSQLQVNMTNNSATGARDIYLFRLAETHLIAAEAAVKANNNTKALFHINKVRDRAKNNAPEGGLISYTGTVTIDDVLDERALELFGEAPRWNDLSRTGKLAERVLKYNWDVNNVTGGVIKTQLSASTNAKYSIRPIPKNWLNTLSNGQELGNNPGWE